MISDQGMRTEEEEREGPGCENCGRIFREGDEVQSQATGTWGEWGAELGDSYVMCLECPDEPEPAPATDPLGDLPQAEEVA